jgi:hypothetical protein
MFRPTEDNGRHDLCDPIRTGNRNHIPGTITVRGRVVLVWMLVRGTALCRALTRPGSRESSLYVAVAEYNDFGVAPL